MAAVRPVNFSNFVGQRRVVKELEIAIEAAQKRGESLDHCLFSGPAGLGKTTLANIIANMMDSELTITSGAVIKSPKDLIGTLVRLQLNDVVFIDEIHRIPMPVEEYLYTAMEDNAIDTIASSGVAIRLDLTQFTLIGATTREGMLSEPLLARFGLILRLESYSVDELVGIVQRAAKKLVMSITDDAARFIAERSRGTPRVALRTQRRVRDYAQVHNGGITTKAVAAHALELIGIFVDGLNKKDLALLEALPRDKRAVGLTTLSIKTHEAIDTLQNVIEPHLIRYGYIERTRVGRVITNKGIRFLESI